MNHMSEHHCPAEDRDVPSPRVEHIPGAEADPDVSCPCLQCYILAEIGDKRLDFPLVQPSFEDAIRATLAGFEFQYEFPEEFGDALEAGLIEPGNNRWMFYDDPQASNYFVLTPAGRKMARELGLDSS